MPGDHDAAPTWARACGWAAMAAALPTVVWRVVVGFGARLGTPEVWRRSEHIPGSGTAYVLMLSVLQASAALLTLILVRPDGDRIPRWFPLRGHTRLPRVLVVGCSVAGIAALTFICVASIVNWHSVDPFASTGSSGWAILCWGCYAAALLWPPLLAVATVGYARKRWSARLV